MGKYQSGRGGLVQSAVVSLYGTTTTPSPRTEGVRWKNEREKERKRRVGNATDEREGFCSGSGTGVCMYDVSSRSTVPFWNPLLEDILPPFPLRFRFRFRLPFSVFHLPCLSPRADLRFHPRGCIYRGV